MLQDQLCCAVCGALHPLCGDIPLINRPDPWAPAGLWTEFHETHVAPRTATRGATCGCWCHSGQGGFAPRDV